jgi:hypothetical protein
MHHLRTVLKAAMLGIALMVALGSAPILAQGSAGGSIGNDDKSVSGSRQERSVDRERPSRPSRQTEQPRRSASRGGGGGGNFDGTWSYVGVGTNCQGSGSGTIVVSGGRVRDPNNASSSGQVSPNGAYRASGVGADGVTLTATGRLSGNAGSGTYMRTDGCAGRWTAARQ